MQFVLQPSLSSSPPISPRALRGENVQTRATMSVVISLFIVVLLGTFPVTALAQTGDGPLTRAAADLAEGQGGASSIADVDGDGAKDVFIASADSDFFGTATLYLGNGDATFDRAEVDMAGVGDAPSLFNAREGSSTSIGDVDDDEDPDLFVAELTPIGRSASSILYENLFDNPIPVELARFKGTPTEDGARLSWQTASETGNAGVEVQRRVVDGSGKTGSRPRSNWTKIRFVESSTEGGTTDAPQSYHFTDETLPYAADRLQYRLRQVDLDGSTNVIEPIEIGRAVEQLQLKKTVPNPAQGQATTRFAVPEPQDVTLRLSDVLGRQVRTSAQTEVEGRQELQLGLSGLSGGPYFPRLTTGGQTRTQKLTVPH